MTSIRTPTPQELSDFAKAVAHLDFFSPQTATDLERAWHNSLANGDSFLGAYMHDDMVGICRFSSSGTFSTGAYLKLVIVTPTAQSQGVGASLLQAYEKACSPHGGYFILTEQSNESAQRFYGRHGYKPVGALPGFASPERTELIYWKVSLLMFFALGTPRLLL